MVPYILGAARGYISLKGEKFCDIDWEEKNRPRKGGRKLVIFFFQKNTKQKYASTIKKEDNFDERLGIKAVYKKCEGG